MKRLLLAPVITLFILLANNPVKATHVSGGNIEYECIGPNQFQITLRLFRDCSGIGLNNNQTVTFNSPCGSSFNQTLTQQGVEAEISQLCETEITNSTCNGGPLPGMEEYIYTATVALPNNCDSWTISYSISDRNDIDNISNSTTEDFSVISTLDNSIPCPNSSPTFTYSGIPYVCVGQNVEFNPGVVETDGDSLVYSLVPPLGNNLNPVTFNPSYSATQPFGPSSPVTFNSNNGQLSFVPDATMANGNWVISIQVCEYRGDSLIGCVSRDFQFVVQNCNNAIPYMIDPGFMNVGSQTTIIDSNSLEVCAGDSFSFQLMFTDSLLGGQPTGDSVISFTNVDAVFPNSNVNVINDDTSIITVNGNIPTTQAGMKSFTVQLEDDACPVPALSILQFDLTVLPKTTITSTSNPDTLCSQTDTTFIEVVGGNQFNWNVLSGEAINPGVNFSDTATVTGNNFWAKPSQTTTYEVVSDNFNGCGNRDTLTVVVSDLITLSPILSDTAICYNDSIELGAVSSSFNSYAWNTGATTPTIFGYGGNNYQVTISDSLGCTAADTADITNYTQLAFGLPVDDTICVAEDSVEIGPGNTFDNYAWSTSSSDSSISVYTPGDYSITATDSNTCTYIDTFNLSHYPDIPYSLPNDTLICYYDSVAIDATNPGFESYYWNHLTDTASSPSVGYGEFSVEATDTNGCVKYDTISIDTSLTFDLLSQLDSICPLDSIDLQVTPTFSQYLWSNGDITQTTTVDAAGIYSVTATDSLGCENYDSVNVIQFNSQPLDLGMDDTICVYDSLTINATSIYDTYSWSNSSTDSSITVNTPDDYSVVVSDSNGCQFADTLTLGNHPDIPFSLPNDTVICIYDSILVDAASTGYSSYSWSHTQNTATSLYLSNGEYYVSATDTNGCQHIDSISITTSGFIDILPATEIICPEDSVEITGDSVLTAYSWSTNETTQSIIADTAGVYTVTGTDTLGCQYSDSTEVQYFNVTQVDLGPDDTLCLGATSVLDAGSGFTSYTWDDATTNQVRTVSQSNDYSVTTTDQNGCLSSDTVNVYFDPGEQFSLGNDTAICPTDSIQLSAPANQQAYSWNTGDTTQNIFAQSGSFSVTVTNTRGCTSSDTINITFRTPPTVSIGSDQYYCENTSFSQPVDPGFGYSSYLWYDGSTNQVNNINEQDDTVWVEVTDGFGCIGSDTLQVIEDPIPSLSLGGGDSICAGQSKALNAGTAGGSIVSYQWSFNNQSTQSINISTNSSINNTSSTDYSVTVTDTNGCVNSDTFTLVVSPLPEPNLGNDTAYCFGDNFQTSLNPGQFTSYSWNTGATSQSITVGASDSTYSVTVTDVNGCSNDDNLRVTENPLPQPNLGADTSICSGVSFNIVLTPGGFENYNWSTGSGNSSILVTQGGNYSVTVTDINGCVNDDTKDINIIPSPQINLGGNRVLCEDSNFAITLDATPALIGPAYGFNWSTAETTDTIQVDDFGTYSVTVTNPNNGCVDSASVDFVPFGTVEPNLGEDGFICEGEAVVLNPSIQSEGYSYTWSTGANTRTITVTNEGSYWVELNAINGTCQGIRDTILLDRVLQPVVELGDQIRACEGQVVELLNEQTGFPNTEYYWQDTIQSRSISVTSSGTYRVKAVNQCGTITDEISVVFDNCYQVFVPDAFTPNGDGVNDEFKAETGQDLIEYSMVIYNRWGEVVFKTNDIRVGWDGTMNGNPLPQDSYVWRISYISALDESRTRKEKQGKVIMIK